MTAPLPAAPDRFSALREAGILLSHADQLRVLDAEMETFGHRIRTSRRPSPAARGVLALVAVFTEAGRHLRRLRMHGEEALWGHGDDLGEHASSAGERQQPRRLVASGIRSRRRGTSGTRPRSA